MALLTTACSAATADHDAGTNGAAAAPAAAPAQGYKSVDDLCKVADLSALTKTFPDEGEPRHETTPGDTETEMTCDVRLAEAGRDDAYGLVQLTVDLYDTPKTALAYYERSKESAASEAPGGKATDVKEVGSEAFTYVAEGVGPRLVTTDGNLIMQIYWGVGATAVSKAGKVPSDIVDRLGAVANATMAKLR